MKRSFGIITIDDDKCQGCVNCLMSCRTEAVRISEGKASILTDRCIYCGKCFRDCPNYAISAQAHILQDLAWYKHTIAIPSPTLYAQFPSDVAPNRILNALKMLGFDDVWEGALGSETASFVTQEYLKTHTGPYPVISSLCPAVIRLIQIRFPNFVEHINPVELPAEIVAKDLRALKARELGISEEELGIFYLVPCPAKMVAVVKTETKVHSYLDGVISISGIYSQLRSVLREAREDEQLQKATGSGIGWAVKGGEIRELERQKALRDDMESVVVDGVKNVIRVLDEIENGKLRNIEFVEARACPEGCVGGALTMADRYVARGRIRKLMPLREDESMIDPDYILPRFCEGYYFHDRRLQPRPSILSLDRDPARAVEKLRLLEDIQASLPGLDCGACGAPNCRALAADVVHGRAEVADCIFKWRERVRELAKDVMKWVDKKPHSIPKR